MIAWQLIARSMLIGSSGWKHSHLLDEQQRLSGRGGVVAWELDESKS